MKFTYSYMGLAQMVDSDDQPHPIDGMKVHGVRTCPPAWSDVRPVVLGLTIYNPYSNDYRAVAATGDVFPPFPDARNDSTRRGPSRDGFVDRRSAALWLMGAHDARQEWFAAAVADQEERFPRPA